MKKIIVEPGRLLDAANKVEQANSDYERVYKALYEEVDKMSASWKGKDNIAFSDQIRSYEADFRQISMILSQYVDFLRNSARAYQDTQDEIFNQANRLVR